MLLILLIGGVFVTAFYSSSFQTVLAKKYINQLQKKLSTNISVDNVNIDFFDDLIISNLYVEDQHQDTLLFVRELKVDISLFSLSDKQILVEKAKLSDVYFNLKKYQTDSVNNLSFIVNYFTPKDTSQTKSEWVFKLNDVEIVSGRFDYNDDNIDKVTYGVDFDHIGVTKINTQLNNIEFIPKGVECEINTLNLSEKSGFDIDSLTTFFNISPKGIMTENLKLVTNKSNVKGNVLFLTNTYTDLGSFIEDVKIKSYFEKSKVDFNDISYFASNLKGINKSLVLEGEIKGSIDNLKARDLSIVFDDGTKFKGKADISGLPDPEDMFMHINFKELITSKKRLEQLPTYPFSKGEYLKLPSNFNHLGAIRFKGSFTGFYHDFVAYGKFNTELGSLKTDLAVKVKNKETTYEGKLITNHFELGKFIQMKESVGDITMDIKIDGKGFSKKDLEANIEGNIAQVVFKNYEYNNVALKGNFSNQVFNGFLGVEDENVSFDFNGNANFSQSIPQFNFISNIKNAKLAKLNFIDSKQKLKTRFSTQLKVNLEGDELNNMTGDIAILNAKYYDKLDSIIMDSTFVTSSKFDSIRKITIRSDVLDFDMEGLFSFSGLANTAQYFIENYIPSLKNEQSIILPPEYNFNFNLELHNSDIISKILLNGAKLSPQTTFSGLYNSSQYKLIVNGDIPDADIFGVHIENAQVNVNSNINSINSGLLVGKIQYNDNVYTDNFKFNTAIANDSLVGSANWKNLGDSVHSEGNINFNSNFDGYTYSKTKINDSKIYISDSLWVFNNDNFIELDSSSVTVRNLKFSSKNQRILIDGTYSDKENDRIDLSLKDFNLTTLKKLIPEESMRLKGVVDGVASVGKKDSSLIFTSDLTLKKIEINDYLVGDGEVKSKWNAINESMELDGKLFRENIPSILLGGVYYPNKIKNSLDLKFELNKTKLSLFESFVDEYVKNIKGTADAKIAIKGTLDKPELNGTITLPLETSFFVNYLNTSFSTKDIKIDVAPDMISFDNVELFDKFGNKGFANGTVYHEWYKNLSLDIGLSVDNFLALNTTAKINNVYYGKTYVTGMMSIGSYNNDMNLDVDVKTEKGTILNIPLDEAEEIEENNFIEFVTKDTLNLKLVEDEVDLSNLNMNFNFEVTPEAEVRLIFDERIGDVMKSRGNGNIKLNVSPAGELEMFGDYIVADGDYLFTLQNVINKRFDLEEGGSIIWNGSPYKAVINITAVYRLRSRLYDLLASMGDTTDVYKKRIPVDLKLNMKNNMLNPDISFDIQLPTADEQTKTKVRSVLYVNDSQENIQELNKQVFSLLVLNRFLPPPGADATTGNASVGATTSSELLSNQLSNWLSKMSNDFDIGVNYHPGDEISPQQLEVALSTQIFNDRVIIDSNFGMSNNNSGTSDASQNSSSIVGDITVEYKITKDGKIRVKAFNKSNQYSLAKQNSAYTQGAGLSYREDFDTWGEFFNKLFGRFNNKKEK